MRLSLSRRTLSPALLMQGWALDQLWLFWVAPILGGIVGGWGYNYFHTCTPSKK